MPSGGKSFSSFFLLSLFFFKEKDTILIKSMAHEGQKEVPSQIPHPTKTNGVRSEGKLKRFLIYDFIVSIN